MAALDEKLLSVNSSGGGGGDDGAGVSVSISNTSSTTSRKPHVLTTYDGPIDVEDSEETKRHILHLVLPATFCIGVGLGNSIAFSAIVIPMMLRNPSWNRDVVIHALGATFAIGGIVSVIVGKNILKWGPVKGPRWLLFIGSVMNAIGLFLEAGAIASGKEWLFYIGFIVFIGISGGVLFMTGTQHVAWWLSSRRGMAGGFMGGSVGCGAVMFNQVLTHMSDDAGPVNALVVVAVVSTLLAVVWVPVMRCPSFGLSVDPSHDHRRVLTPKQILHSWQLWVCSGMVAFTLIAGYGIISDINNMFDIVSFPKALPTTAAEVEAYKKNPLSTSATNAATVAFAFYAAGRFAMGFACDRLGVKVTYALIAGIQMICYFILPSMSTDSEYGFVIVTIIGLTMSGGGKVLAAACAKHIYGKESATIALGLILCFGLVPAGIIGPELIAGSGLRGDDTSNPKEAYNVFFYVMAGFQSISLVFTYFVDKYDFKDSSSA